MRRRTQLPIWTKLAVELHAGCNRDCAFCPRFGDRSGIRKDSNGAPIQQQMPTERVFDILEQAVALGYRGEVCFHRLSDPFLDPRYLEFATWANEHGLRVADNTNGDVLKVNPGLCTQVDGVVKKLTIGLYDFTTHAEKQAEKAFWRSRFQETELAFSMPSAFPALRQGSAVYEDRRRDRRILDRPCFATRKFLIRYDGQVAMCCEDDPCEFDLGNAFVQPIAEIWWSSKHVDLVRGLESRGARHEQSRCAACYNEEQGLVQLARKAAWKTAMAAGLARVKPL